MSKPKKAKTVEEKYKKISQKQHILEFPETYIDSNEPDTREMWVYDDKKEKIVYKEITFVPGLYKTFDELLVNARDQSERSKLCNIIKVTINEEEGYIRVYNNGSEIPNVIHKEHNVYVPELIFGVLLTSENYDKSEKKTVGGKNGYGAKLANIFSTKFIVENVHDKTKYVQEFRNNMSEKDEPKITPTTDKPYVQVTYYPDFKRFGIKKLTSDITSLFKKRVFDIAGCTNKVKVYLNEKLIDISKFEEFINLHYDTQKDVIYEEFNDRWKVGTVFGVDTGLQVSFVNGIWTYLGGSHVNYILDQIIKKMAEYIFEKFKLKIKPQQVRDNLTIFISSVIVNPGFTSQTKTALTTKIANFGSTCEIGNAFMSRLYKTGIIEEVVNLAKFKEDSLLKKSDGKKVASLRGIPKLIEARWAGTRKSKETRLILTEGDSASSYAESGLDVVGRERFGIFPLRGKLLNVRKASINQINKNEEFKKLKQILGLKQGIEYTDIKKLRYGGIIILSDQDLDGFHIRGLIINMFQHFWPSLVLIKGFIQSMSTPLIKVFKANDKRVDRPLQTFYSVAKYKEWADKNGGNKNKYRIKYYKGLGTSDPLEAKMFFNEYEKRIISYVWEKPDLSSDDLTVIENNEVVLNNNKDDEEEIESSEHETSLTTELITSRGKSYDAIIKAFDKDKESERKEWLRKYNPDIEIDNEQQDVYYSDFIDKQLIHFSNYDNVRSIPSLIDGFKPSHRKILYTCFMMGIKQTEIKVADLAGLVNSHTEYKHGPASLHESIVNMAQNYPCSNNINLLHPQGNFGFRSGAEHASERYIYTYVEQLTDKIFRKEDLPILKKQFEDNKEIEPYYYVPIIPMVLVNGAEGIGTGYSTFVPSYDPISIVTNILRMMDDKKPFELIPWYYGFTGETKKISENKYKITGKYEIIDDEKIRITEIPYKGLYSTGRSYKLYLESLIGDKNDKNTKILDVFMNKGNNKIDFEVTFKGNALQQMIKKGDEAFEKMFKLSTSLTCNNMYMYNNKNELTHYNSPQEILDEFYNFRLGVYTDRKKYMLRFLENELNILKWKVQFIKDKTNDIIILDKQSKEKVHEKLKELKYPKLSHNIDASDEEKTYDYIERMGIFSVTQEKIDELNKEFNEKQKEYNDYLNTSEKEFWKRELKEFISIYDKWMKERIETEACELPKRGKGYEKPSKKTRKSKK